MRRRSYAIDCDTLEEYLQEAQKNIKKPYRVSPLQTRLSLNSTLEQSPELGYIDLEEEQPDLEADRRCLTLMVVGKTAKNSVVERLFPQSDVYIEQDSHWSDSSLLDLVIKREAISPQMSQVYKFYLHDIYQNTPYQPIIDLYYHRADLLLLFYPTGNQRYFQKVTDYYSSLGTNYPFYLIALDFPSRHITPDETLIPWPTQQHDVAQFLHANSQACRGHLQDQVCPIKPILVEDRLQKRLSRECSQKYLGCSNPNTVLLDSQMFSLFS